MSHGDYLELNLYLDEGDSADLWVHTRRQEMVKFTGVNSNPIRHDGMWMIPHVFFGKPVSSLFPEDEVWYFTIGPVTEEQASCGVDHSERCCRECGTHVPPPGPHRGCVLR